MGGCHIRGGELCSNLVHDLSIHDGKICPCVHMGTFFENMITNISHHHRIKSPAPSSSIIAQL